MALVLWNNKELRIHELYEHESKKKWFTYYKTS